MPPTAIQFSTVDASAYANEYVLPGTLGQGLQALYFFDRGIARSSINLAPLGVQGAAFVGAPTVNADGSMTLSNTGYLQTPIMQTTELTVMMVVSSMAPLAGEVSILFSNTGSDTARTPPAQAGVTINNNTASTPPDGKLGGTSIWGNTGDSAGIPAGPSQLLDIPQWRTPSLLYTTAGTSSERMILGSQTLGTLQQTTLQTKPLFNNLSLPFRLGMNYVGGALGSVNMAVCAYYNRIITAAERTAFQAWISPRLLRKHGYTV